MTLGGRGPEAVSMQLHPCRPMAMLPGALTGCCIAVTALGCSRAEREVAREAPPERFLKSATRELAPAERDAGPASSCCSYEAFERAWRAILERGVAPGR
jgi:hypothetical protein